jgi:hypothetical protein
MELWKSPKTKGMNILGNVQLSVICHSFYVSYECGVTNVYLLEYLTCKICIFIRNIQNRLHRLIPSKRRLNRLNAKRRVIDCLPFSVYENIGYSI